MTIHYGKAEIGVYRTDGISSLFAAEVTLDVYGENFMPAYTEGDNSLVVATDTMKNFVHSNALEYAGESLEGLLELLGERFLATYDHVERIRLEAREIPFERQSDVLFQRCYGDRGVAELELGREGVLDRRSGREGVHLIKITGSSFTRFARDDYTTLPETVDRPLFVHLDVHWRYLDEAGPIPSTDVRDSVAETFDDFNSESIQHLVHEMGRRLLDRFPVIAELSFEAQNRLWDTAHVSEADERVKVYTDPRPPYGMIGLTLRR
jgi:urate oxidase / 2-oxo-4-hydroxy-4-carboxy-5-ureidoimidazoline decarboxylase